MENLHLGLEPGLAMRLHGTWVGVVRCVPSLSLGLVDSVYVAAVVVDDDKLMEHLSA